MGNYETKWPNSFRCAISRVASWGAGWGRRVRFGISDNNNVHDDVKTF